jgi:hypothetical protein
VAALRNPTLSSRKGFLSEKSDEELIAAAQTGQDPYQGVSLEASRRLRRSIDALRRSSDRYACVMVILTVALVFLTVVLTILTALLVHKELWLARP